jgi:Ca-activated chloride channel family protein
MEIAGLLDNLAGDQIGLIAFAGVAFLQCPLTVDYSAARMLLDAMSPDLIPVGGTALSEAIRVAMQAYPSKELRYKALIIITDGEDNTTDPGPIAKEAAKQGIRIYTIGVGRPEGQPIPIRDASGAVTGYRKDSKGNVVSSKLDATTLKSIASATGGRFYAASLGQNELHEILQDIQTLERRELRARNLEKLEDRFQLFVLLALICLAIEALIPERARETGEWGGRFA